MLPSPIATTVVDAGLPFNGALFWARRHDGFANYAKATMIYARAVSQGRSL
jgi:hypothetical protein